MRVLFICLFLLSFLFGEVDNSFSDEFSDEFKTQETKKSWDPLEGYNIQMTKFNDFFYINALSPITKGYKNIVAKPIREGVSNFFNNLLFPSRFVNNLLQFKFKNAFEESGRFIINSTFGLAGFIDIAKKEAGLNQHNEDFGQTLGFYGFTNDLHIVLPLFGPSNLRDFTGNVIDSIINPIDYSYKQDNRIFNNDGQYILLKSYKTIHTYSLNIDKYENISKDSINLYLLLKTVYEQRRNKMIEE